MTTAESSVRVTTIDLKTGEVLFREGEKSKSVFVVISGRLRVSVTTSSGRKEIGQLGPNQLVGEMALFSEEPRVATVEAAMPTTVYELDTFNFEVYFKQQPDWLKILIKALIAKIKIANEKVLTNVKG